MDKLLWIDMEMTGLDVRENVIIELAAIVTDLQMKALEEYHEVVYQPPEELAKMDAWNQNTHGGSGLLAKIPHGKPLYDVESEVLALIGRHFDDEVRPVLTGNSIQQDRKFIEAYMFRLEQRLHYRMIDVSSFKQIFNHIYGVRFSKTGSHRALDDIHESIRELQCYLGHIRVGERVEEHQR